MPKKELNISGTWLLKYLIPIIMIISGLLWAHKVGVVDPAVYDATKPIKMLVLENNYMLQEHVTVEDRSRAKSKIDKVRALEK